MGFSAPNGTQRLAVFSPEHRRTHTALHASHHHLSRILRDRYLRVAVQRPFVRRSSFSLPRRLRGPLRRLRYARFSASSHSVTAIAHSLRSSSHPPRSFSSVVHHPF